MGYIASKPITFNWSAEANRADHAQFCLKQGKVGEKEDIECLSHSLDNMPLNDLQYRVEETLRSSD